MIMNIYIRFLQPSMCSSLVKDMYPRNNEHVRFSLGLASYWDLTTANIRQSTGHSSFVREGIAVTDIDSLQNLKKGETLTLEPSTRPPCVLCLVAVFGELVVVQCGKLFQAN